MSGLLRQGMGYGLTRLSSAIGGLADTVRSAAAERIEHMAATWRAEVRRVATALALSLTLVFFVCAAAAFAMFALMLSFWETHRVLVAWLITGAFIAFAWLAAILLRNFTQSGASTDD